MLLLLVLVIIGFLFLSFRPHLQEPSVVPIIGSENPVYSLDAEVVGSADIDDVYLLEYRGSPNYRIMHYDAASEDLTEVFNVPAGGLVYGIALSPSKDRLAIGYTADFSMNGNGVYLLDLKDDSRELVELVADSQDTHYFDLEWAQDNTLWVTETNLALNKNAVSQIDTANGAVSEVVADAIDPTVIGDSVAYFPLEPDESRRSVEAHNMTSNTSNAIDVFSKGYDLDNLAYNPNDDQILVSALNRSGGITLRFGETVHAHGNHNIPSSWAVLSGEGYGSATDSQLESKLVYDAAVTNNGELLEVTNEGLYIGRMDGKRELLVKSRALRFIAY